MKRRDFLKGTLATVTLPIVAKVNAETDVPIVAKVNAETDVPKAEEKIQYFRTYSPPEKLELYIDGISVPVLDYSYIESISMPYKILEASIYPTNIYPGGTSVHIHLMHPKNNLNTKFIGIIKSSNISCNASEHAILNFEVISLAGMEKG